MDFFSFLARNVGAVTTFRTVYTKPPIIWRVETTERQVSAGKYLLEFALKKFHSLHRAVLSYFSYITILQNLLEFSPAESFGPLAPKILHLIL